MRSTLTRIFLLSLCALGLWACPPSLPGDGGTDGGACGPFTTTNEELLNAGTDGTVVPKTSAIPEGAYP
jgi:hypothetical protein